MKTDLGRHAIELTPDGAAWIAEFRTLAVADLHFEKGSFFSRFSSFLPPYDSGETLRRLAALISRYRPEIFIAAGDSFHDSGAADRLHANDRAALNSLIDSVPSWHWLAGNHDPAAPGSIRGAWDNEFLLSGVAFRHRLTQKPGAEISGHYHPKIRIALNGHRLSLPCFVQAGDRLILPSFGHYTGGLDIDSMAFANIVPSGDRLVYGIYQDRVFRL